MTTEKSDETCSGLRYLCPSCKIPILVGKHSITIDRQRIKAAALDELIKAATHVDDSAGIPFDKSTGYRAIEVPKLNRLRDALESIKALWEESKR